MKRFTFMAILLLSPGLISAAAAQTEASSITGLWKVESNIMGQSVGMMCALTETNHRLSGVCSGAQDGYVAHKIAGTVKAQNVEFYFQAAWGGNSLTTIVSGTLNEDRTTMDGSMDVKPMGGDMDAASAAYTGSLSAMKELEHDAAAAQADATAAQPDATAAQAWAADVQAGLATGVNRSNNNEAATARAATEAEATGEASSVASMVATGTWKIDGTVMGSPVTMTCVLTEAEHKLAGTCSGAGQGRTPRALTGTTTAKGVGWRFDDEYGGQSITFSMNATLAADGKKMNGTMTISPMGVGGTFAGVKQ